MLPADCALLDLRAAPFLALTPGRRCCAGKLAPSEKRLASSLDKQLINELGGAEEHAMPTSISPASASPLGSVNEAGTRKLLINLILTLNNTFADYDFR